MKFQQIQPPPFLKDYVRYFWTLESDHADPDPMIFRPIVDGCPGLIFQSDTVSFYDMGGKKLPGIFLYGQTTVQNVLSATGKFNTIGVYLYPNALKTIFGINADELTNSCMDVNDFSKKHHSNLYENLLNVTTTAERVEIISAYLFALVQQNTGNADVPTLYAIAKISGADGNVSLKQIQEELKLSERSFERRFKRHVGISPKLYSRICRFQASLKQLRANNYEKLSDIAFENEYSDQSHFIRAFKEFVGTSPHQFQKKTKEIVENFPIVLK